LFDGRTYQHSIPGPTILDNLTADGRIDPIVAVFWDYPHSDLRNEELECNAQFADCMAEELLPWVRARYHVTDDPTRTVAGGFSAGGLGVAHLGWTHPDRFGKILSQSGWFGCAPRGGGRASGWLPGQYRDSPRPSLEFYLDAGTTESGGDGAETQILPSNHRFRDLLRSSGNIVHYAEFSGGHDPVNWRGTLSDGIQALLPRRSTGS
jgi:enterochelin esterase family protein